MARPPLATGDSSQRGARRFALALGVGLSLGLGFAGPAHAQLSFSSAVDLAVIGSPRVRMAQDDVKKARAALVETTDVYVPSVSGVLDLGYSYGPPLGQPTLFSFSAQSLVFTYSQHDYTRSARSGLNAAVLALAEMRQQVAEDAAVTYLSLDRAQQRRAALVEESDYANRLIKIVQERLDAGQDTSMELLRSRHTAAQIHLSLLLLEDEIANYRHHLSRLDGLPDGTMYTVSDSIPAFPEIATQDTGVLAPMGDGPGVSAAFANARAKQEQAFGDARYLYRPQISLFSQYSRFSTFNNYQIYYPAFSNHTLNAITIGIQVSIPFYDRSHQDKSKESMADADRAQQDALNARADFLEGRLKLTHASSELSARAELADLEAQMSQQQLEVVLLQLKSGNGNSSGPQLSPKDEQNAHIEERARYLDLLDARFKLREAQIHLLKQNGQLDTWMRSTMGSQGSQGSMESQPGSSIMTSPRP